MSGEAPERARFSDRPHGIRRTRRITVTYTDEEFAFVAAASQAAGLTPTGYVAEAAVAAAGDGEPPGTSPWRLALFELMDARSRVRRIGVNINQAARVLNATGDAPVWLEQPCPWPDAPWRGWTTPRPSWPTWRAATASRRGGRMVNGQPPCPILGANMNRSPVIGLTDVDVVEHESRPA